jgi:RNA polymerase sigma-70 factor (ECF subfamily)
VSDEDDRIVSIEARTEEAWRAEDYAASAQIVLDGYGGEIYTFLVAQFRGRVAHADDAYSMFEDDLRRSIDSFRWRSSARAWGYRLARAAANRQRKRRRDAVDRQVTLRSFEPGDDSREARPSQRPVSSTRPYLRADVNNEYQLLRESLTLEEQDLLILRVDRNLAWDEIAYAMRPLEAGEPDDEDLRGGEATYRQRFAEVRARLKSLAEDAGLFQRP